MPTPPSTPARTRGYKKKERTRRELLAAAIHVIAARGDAFTVLDVVRQAEVSNGTFYNYFDDREALIDAVTSQVVGAFTAASDEAVEEDDPARRFAIITAMLFDHAAASPQLAGVLLRLESMTLGEPSGEDPIFHLRSDLAQGAASGRFDRGPNAATLDLVTGTLLRAVRRIVTADGDSDADYRGEVIGTILRALGVEAAEAAAIATEAVATAADHRHPTEGQGMESGQGQGAANQRGGR